MANPTRICDTIFYSYASASSIDQNLFFALCIDESLAQRKTFDISNIFLKYMLRCSKMTLNRESSWFAIYEEFSKQHGSPTEALQLTEDSIKTLVAKALQTKLSDSRSTYRSFSLAICPYIATEDLFQFSKHESQIMGENPISGDVSGVVNLIIRYRIENLSWDDAVNQALLTGRLHHDFRQVHTHYQRSNRLPIETTSSTIINPLISALYYVTNNKSAKDAIEHAQNDEDSTCVVLTGILAATCWQIEQKELDKIYGKKEFDEIRKSKTAWSNHWRTDNNPKA